MNKDDETTDNDSTAAASVSAGSTPPRAPQRPHEWVRPTGNVSDPFAWMRDVEDREFLDYLTAENAYADHWFEPLNSNIDAIFDEIKSRVQETDMSTPVRNGDWWYVSKTHEGLSYPTHHRGPTSESAADIVLLDENVEADGHDYFDLGALDLSADHSLAAWSMDVDGDEHYTLRIRDLSTGGDFDDVIHDVAHAGTAWSDDGNWLFYVTADEQERPSKVWRHHVGAPVDDDVCIFTESDERFFVGIGTTRSDEWIVVHSGSKTSAETRLIPAADPTAAPAITIPRSDGVEYSLDHWGDVFLLHTNDEAVDFRLLTAPVAGGLEPLADPDSWTELESHMPGRRITGAEPFADHLVIHEWVDAQPRLRVRFRDGDTRIIDLGTSPHDVDLSSNPEWTTNTVRFGTQSMSVPPSLYDEDIRSGERTLLRQIPTPNVDLDAYRSHRTWAPSAGGVRVPIDIVHHVATKLDGSAPGVIYGYGSYEASLAPWFSVARLSLLDRGFVFALAHPRGGGELGRQWYLDGKLLNKRNTFDDMVAVAEHLVAERVIGAERVALRGGSAGGLLVGACLTQRPELFSSVVAEVPFVDIVNTISDPSLPLTITEWEEWGDPRSEPYASVIASYSPYENSVAADYPALYVSAGLNDPRVSVHEPAKWVARLRDVSTGSAPIVMRTEMGAGHGGPSGRYEAWRDEARTLAFLAATT